MIETPFKLTESETLCSAAATLCLQRLTVDGVQTRQLGSVAEKPQYGYTASATDTPTPIRFLRITDIKAGSVDWTSVPFCECEQPDSYLLKTGDLLVARSGSVGKSFLIADVPEPAVFASYMIRIRTKSGVIPEFAFWCFQSQQFWEQLMSQRRGSAMANINSPMLSGMEFPIPSEPLQKGIAEFLNKFRQYVKDRRVSVGELPPPLKDIPQLVARIEALAAQIHEASTLRQQATEEAEALSASWLNSAFDTLAQKFARSLGDVTEIIGGGSLPDTTLVEGSSSDVLLVKVSDMNRPGNEVFIRDSAVGLPNNSPLLRGFRVLPPQSIVFPKRGGAIATNKKRILTKPAVLDPNTMGVFPKQESELCHEFLFKWFNNLDLASLQQGTSVPQINKSDFAPLQIPIPPLAEQRRIVAELDALQAEVDTLKRLQAETAAELDALLPAILDRAFKGEL